jgi:hypothetical protein
VIGMRVCEHDRVRIHAFEFPNQSSPQSIITFALRYETSSDVCIRCRRVRASISPRVPRNVSFIGEQCGKQYTNDTVILSEAKDI